jgi:hypothetical protein
MFPLEHRVPAQFQQENSEVRLERPDFAEDGELFTLIEELLGQEQQADRFPLSLFAAYLRLLASAGGNVNWRAGGLGRLEVARDRGPLREVPLNFLPGVCR